MKPLSTSAFTLLRAADILEKEGWHQGSYGTGPHCAVGALSKAMGREWPSNSEAVTLLRRYVGGPPNWSMIQWNDQPGQTKENVIATMRAAAMLDAKQ